MVEYIRIGGRWPTAHDAPTATARRNTSQQDHETVVCKKTRADQNHVRINEATAGAPNIGERGVDATEETSY